MPRLVGLAPPVVASLVGVPIAAGLLFTVLPAFDVMPALGRTAPSLDGWETLAGAPGFATALRLTVTTGFGAALLSFALAVLFSAEALTRPGWRWTRAALLPVLASPHSAVALGLAFLLAPSGWLVRLLSPWATGWTAPPVSLVTVRDPWGLALVAGLVVKETPFLVLMIGSAAAQVPATALLAAAGTLGQRPASAWLKAVFPSIYRQIRLPVFAVLAFSLSVVDVALVLAPGAPPPLAVLAVRWLTGPDLDLYGPGAAAATLVALLVLAGIALWWAAERPVAWMARRWAERGGASPALPVLAASGARLAGALGSLACAALAGLALWSFARAWPYPDAWPTGLGLATWAARGRGALAVASTTALIGAATAAAALVIALACLEGAAERPGRGLARWVLYAPLVVPQVAFLFGVQALLVRADLDGGAGAVAACHLVFVLPYVLLSLADPHRALDPRYAAAAAALGAGPARVFLAVKLPLLLRPILVAGAVGFAVSLAQYLPTLFAGAGRVATLTTEAVALSSGGDRRIVGCFAALGAALPLAAYALAVAVPVALSRKRRGWSG